MEQMVSNRVWFMRCDVVYGRDVWTRWCRFVYGGGLRSHVLFRWCRIVYGGEMRGRVWDTCMEQRVPCMEHVVPVLYETGGDREYM
jgi:hypothetical protein